MGRFSLVLDGGVGAGGTRKELKPANNAGPATYGDTGLRFLLSVGAGVRFELSQHFAVRLEVHDLIFSDRVQSVNGCSAADLRAMDQALRNGMTPGSANVSSGCHVDSFQGTDPKTGLNRANDVPLANNLVKPPISSVLVQNASVRLGATFQF